LHELSGHSFLYAVNAGSNEVSVFRVDGSKLTWLDNVSSHGTTPISVTAHNELLYVLNAGDAGNISGYHIEADGRLSYLQNSTKPLSGNDVGPAQIQFNNAGTQIVVTEKNTNGISTYSVHNDGLTSDLSAHSAVGITPFGFGFDNHDQLIVTDAFGGGAGQSAVGPKGTRQTSACWLAITNNSKYCYSANTGSNSITGYRIVGGRLSLLSSSGVTAVSGTTPIDIAVSNNSKFLYNLNSGSHSITEFRVNEDGSLGAISTVGNLPSGAVGLVAK
jgi:6-phosphogluconolactonase (cycloisomerase 2 family)